MKDELKRIKAGLLAGVMCLTLSGCASSNGFEFGCATNREIAVYRNSAVNNTFIGKCYVAEVYNKLTESNELYIVSAHKNEEYVAYDDVFTPYSVMFTDDNERNNFFVFKKVIPLVDYINALGLVKHSYTYSYFQEILKAISEVHEYEDNLELTK
jgi:hypothetical protein